MLDQRPPVGCDTNVKPVLADLTRYTLLWVVRGAE